MLNIKKKNALKENIFGYAMVAPTIIGLAVLNFYPLIYTFYLSFMKSIGFGKYEFVGFANYEKMFASKEVWQSLGNSILFSVYTVPIGIFLALVFACLLNSKIRGKGFYRTMYFLPVVCASTAVAVIWRWLYNSDFGLINHVLNQFNIQSVNWLTDPSIALFSISIVAIWSKLGYNIVLLLAGLQAIPETYYEAAEIDGAGPIRKFFHISVPLVTPTLFFVVITTVMEALKQFDFIYMMITRQNPALESCQTLLNVFYEYAFVSNQKGYASAIVILAFAVIMLVTGLQFIGQKKWVNYD